MNTSRARQCQGKVRHATARAAGFALRLTIAFSGKLTLNYYRCPHCDGFHVGHPKKTEQRRLRYRRLIDLIDKANANTAKGTAP